MIETSVIENSDSDFEIISEFKYEEGVDGFGS